jgi:hypothetical protein
VARCPACALIWLVATLDRVADPSVADQYRSKSRRNAVSDCLLWTGEIIGHGRSAYAHG